MRSTRAAEAVAELGSFGQITMRAPGVYIPALIVYGVLGGAFCLACLLLAIIPGIRSAALRAAVSMIATYLGVLLYQFVSLPLLAVLFAGRMIPVSGPVSQLHGNLLLAYFFAPLLLLGTASVAGFISGWRVAQTALIERSLSAGLRRDLLLGCYRRFRGRRRKGTEPGAAPNGGGADAPPPSVS